MSTPAAPTVFPTTFSTTVATFCGQLVQNLEQGVALSPNPSTNPTILYGILAPLTFIATLNTTFDSDPVIGYVAADLVSNTLYVVTRGTLTQNEWKQDFEFQQAALPAVFGVPTATASAIAVHTGFLTLFQQYQSALLTAINKYPVISRVVVTGHSLGAALASLNTLYLASALSKNTLMYAFAKPRVGNLQYAAYMSTLVPLTLFYLCNQDDLVPQLPFSVTICLANPSVPWVYQHEGTMISFSVNWGGLGLNHLMQNYMTWLATQPVT